MVKFKLNDRDVEIEEGRTLINYLREECDLTSVKNGCGEGACGACMVLVDGKATKACILKSDKIEGKEIQTVEGLSDRDKRYLLMPLVKQVQYNADFVFLEW